jgi:hypothetical protein
MQCLEVSGTVRHMYMSLGGKGLRKNLTHCYVWNTALLCAANWTLREVDRNVGLEKCGEDRLG